MTYAAPHSLVWVPPLDWAGLLPFPLSQARRTRRTYEGPVTSRSQFDARRSAVAAAVATPRAPAKAKGEGVRPPAPETAVPAAKGAPLVFDAVYTNHFHHVARWARALGGLAADVDDLTQDVFLVVRRKLPSFAGPSLPAWLYGITRKTVSDYRRRAFMRRLLSGVIRSAESAPETSGPAGIDSYERLEARQLMVQVLERMSSVRRTAFVLFEIEGYSGEEIAELEQIPLATVYTRLHHARKDFLRFTAELTGQAPEEPPP
jgi:RNA polymerase sigma-70 factor, ECF subfamily